MPDGRGPISEEQLALEQELYGGGLLGVTTPEMALTGEITTAPPGTIIPPAAATATPAAAPARTEQERITAALGGPLQAPQAGPAPGIAIPRDVLRTATGEELAPSALLRTEAAPGAEPYAGRQFGAPAARVGVTTVQTALQSDTDARAQAALGDRGPQLIAELRAQGIPEDTIRARLGMAPAARGGVGGMMRAPKPPELPPELQRPYETLYPPDWFERVKEAEAAGTIDAKTSDKLIAGWETWKKSPEGAVAAAREHARQGEVELGRIEQEQALEEQRRQAQYKALYEQQVAKGTAEAAAQKAWQDDYDTELQEQTARYERSIEEAKRARIDPDRARIPIVDALAAAAGQFAAIMTGTPNAALQQINARLDRDIAAQEQTIKGLQSNVAMRRNRLGLLRERLGDRQAAVAAEKRLQLEQVQAELNRIATDSKIEQNRLGAQKLATELDIQIQAMKDDENTRNAIESQNRAAMRHQQRLGAANARARQREQEKQLAYMQQTGMGPWTAKEADKMQKRFIPGFGFVASEGAAKEVRDNLSKFDTTIRAFEGLLRIAEVPGASTDPEMRARAESLVSQADLGLAVANNLGAISASDAEFVKNQRGDPTAILSIGGKTRLQQTLGDLRANRRKALARHHFVPGEMTTTMQQPKRGETPVPALSYRLKIPGAGPPQQQAQPGAMSIPETELAP